MKSSPASREAAQRSKILALTAEVEDLTAALHGADADEIIKTHIELLHTYNERKDGAMILIGKLASLQQITVAEASAKLGIDADD